MSPSLGMSWQRSGASRPPSLNAMAGSSRVPTEPRNPACPPGCRCGPYPVAQRSSAVGRSQHRLGSRLPTIKYNCLARLSEIGDLTRRVADVLPGAEVAEAHRRLRPDGVRGRLVLDLT